MSQTVIVFQEDCLFVSIGREGRYPGLLQVEKIKLASEGDPFERWQQALDGLSAEWKAKPARLVLPAGMCSNRVLKLPYAKGKQFTDMASREIGESFRGEIADYTVLFQEKRKSVDICAGGADRLQLGRFMEICTASGITVSGITVPMEGYLNVLQESEGYVAQTAIYLFFEEGSMTSILCQNGRYLYSSRSRLFGEPGTIDFGTEIVRSISGILQFYASEKSEIPITDVYYAGCPEADFEVSIEGIRSLKLRAFPIKLNRQISVLGQEEAGDWIPCIGALMQKNKKVINLYQIYKKNLGKPDKRQGIGRHLIVPAVIFLLCLILTGVITGMNLAASAKVSRQQEWIDSVSTQEKYTQALEQKERLARIKNAIGEVKQTEQNLKTYPQMSGDLMHQIENVGGHRIEFSICGYDADDGVLTFEASSREVIDVPAYILQLQKTGLFQTVDYTGYNYENEWYRLSLSCVMKGNPIE